MQFTFEDREVNTVTNCLRIAAEQFRAHAKTFRDTANMESVKASESFITSVAAERIAGQFDRQEQEALCLASRLDAAGTVCDQESADSCEAYQVPDGYRLRSRLYRNDQCGRAGCTRCYTPLLTERDERGGYIVPIREVSNNG